MRTRAIRVWLVGLGLMLVGPQVARAQPQPGECATGFCGTPNNNGGGGCGCGGGSILVNNTDIGQTYSKTDDYDADGIADDFDNCPFVANRDQADRDADKVGDACDNCVAVGNPDQRDVNANRIGDACDPDIDGDKIANAQDNCPYVPNVAQTDTNKNGVGDACDPDMDGDAVLNPVDNCPLVYNPDQAKSAPGRYGDACDADGDKDTIDDSKDNCPTTYNPDQLDTNHNGLGDVCDPDMDGDQWSNANDNCPLVPNADQKDSDKDGVGDACQTHGFCFVVGLNRVAKCLDPTTVFAVTAAPLVQAKTGESVKLHMFANRENVGIKYSWAVVSQPDGANDVVSPPQGTATNSEAFEYHYADDASWPKLTVTHPGTYTIRLAADLVKPDPLYPSVGHAESDVQVQVDGPTVGAGGCSTSRARGEGLFGLALIAGVLGLIALRRRR